MKSVGFTPAGEVRSGFALARTGEALPQACVFDPGATFQGQTRRPALAHHVHRIALLGARVLINALWYKVSRAPPRTSKRHWARIRPDRLTTIRDNLVRILPEGFAPNSQTIEALSERRKGKADDDRL